MQSKRKFFKHAVNILFVEYYCKKKHHQRGYEKHAINEHSSWPYSSNIQVLDYETIDVKRTSTTTKAHTCMSIKNSFQTIHIHEKYGSTKALILIDCINLYYPRYGTCEFNLINRGRTNFSTTS